jgi:ribosomal protein S18 acetylase RimI-like enzyme
MITSADLPRLRSLLGASTVLWAGEGNVSVEPGRWKALSGARTVDYNVVLHHGRSDVKALSRTLVEIAARGAPALVMVAGEALGDVQQLIEARWICVGSVPFMARVLDADQLTPSGALAPRAESATLSAHKLAGIELDGARALVDEAFGLGPKLALIALPDEAATRPGQAVWGAFDETGALLSCLGTVQVEDIIAIWSMATAACARHRGYGARALNLALADAASSGVQLSLLHSTSQGEPFYCALGYRVLERWQMWSRPRWVLGRS